MTALTFLHPGLLFALPAALAPAIIHWIGRRHAPVVYFAAFDFLMAVNQKLAARERLRQWLLLALRTLAILTLVLAVSRPSPSQLAPQAKTAQRRVAIIVDTSASMAFVDNKTSYLDAAIERGLEVLSHLDTGDKVTCIAAGPSPEALFSAPSFEHAKVREALQAMRRRVPQGTADMAQALEMAAHQLSDAVADAASAPTGDAALLAPEPGGPVGDIFVISDMAANSFAHLKPWPKAPGPEVHLIEASVAPGASEPRIAGNVAIRDVSIGHNEGHANLLERTLSVRLENFGLKASLSRAIVLYVDDAPVVRATVDVPANSAVDKVLTYTFLAPGAYKLAVHLGPSAQDGLAADDVWRGRLDITRALRVLAVDGEPRSAALDDELYFVQRALEAVPAREPAISVQSVPLSQMAQALDGAPPPEVCLLAHPSHLDAEAVARLVAFVQGGGGLLLTLGTHVDFEALNSQLGPILPHALRDLTQAADPGTQAASVGIGSFDWRHPILQDLGDGAEQSLRRSQTRQYFNLETGSTTQARALLRFDNGAPALIEQRRKGQGRVLLWTTSIDVDLTDLPLRTAFVPLMQRSVRYLGQALAPMPTPIRRTSERFCIQVPDGIKALRLIGPSAQQVQATLETQGAHSACVKGLDEAGVWEVQTEAYAAPGIWAPAPELATYVNANLDESNFARTSAQAVAQQLGGPAAGSARQSHAHAGLDGWQSTNQGHVWTLWLMLGLVVIVAAESVLAARG